MAEQLFQIGVKALIQNDAGQILLLSSAGRDGGTFWDIPGGRMEPNESIEGALGRELTEEIGVTFEYAEQLTAVLSNITIPVGDTSVALMLVIYTVTLASDAVITLDQDGPEQGYDWYEPSQAAVLLQNKYPADFCKRIGEL